MCDAGHRDNVVEILQRPATKSFTPSLLQGVEDFKSTNRQQAADDFKTTNHPQLADDFNNAKSSAACGKIIFEVCSINEHVTLS